VGAPFTVKALPLTVREEVKRSVDEAVVEKRLVVVAEVEVELIEVKFRSVEEPVRRRLERVERPPVTVRVPVKLAAAEIVWLLMLPEVMTPVLREVENKFVLEALVEKKFVVVALVPVAVVKVKDWRVEEPVTKRSPDELMLVVAEPPMFRELAKRELEKKAVEVAEVVVDLVMELKI